MKDHHMAVPLVRGGVLAKHGTALAVFLTLIALCLAAMSGMTLKNRLAAPAELEIARAGEVDIPPSLHGALLSYLNSSPLDQSAANLLFSIEVRQGADPARLAGMLDALKKLGWRHTSAQRNIVYEALLAEDAQEAIRRIDAMLRRDQMRADIMPVLYKLEERAEVSDMLAHRMKKLPNWRAAYFAKADHLDNRTACTARANLFASLAKEGENPEREELKPSLEYCIKAAEYETSLRLAETITGPVADGGLNHDRQFHQAADLSAQTRQQSLPGEWQTRNRRGLNVSFRNREDAPFMAIRWDGRGAPLIVEQFVHLHSERNPTLRMTGRTQKDLRNFSRLRAEWSCAGQKPVRFVSDRAEQTTFQHHYRLSGPVGCEYGWLRLFGAPTDHDAGNALQLTEIALLPAAAG